MIRGTRLERYISVPRSRAFRPAIPGPIMNVQSLTATRARWVMTSEVASTPVAPGWRRVTTARTLTTPMAMTAASNPRLATNRTTRPSCCRLTIENSATAVPMPARAVMTSRKAPRVTWYVRTGAQGHRSGR